MDLIKFEDGIALLDIETSNKIAEFERMAKSIKEQEDLLREKILNEMESKGIVKLETDNLTISYSAPTQRETFDSKALREANPDVYDAYVKFSDVKSNIRIKLK